ncbi:MAG: MMPL family transporter [Proteobacteria bacterium]|nr:MMPL family transporter [Pseudomonadota bacterium]
MRSLLESWLFGRSRQVLILLAVLTVFLTFQATRLAIDAGFEKQLPKDHPWMDVFREYQSQFGGANRLLIAVRDRDGNLFNPDSLEKLNKVTRALGSVPGVDRSAITSIFTPNVRFVRIVEGGFEGGNVVPADWKPTEEMAELVRENALQSGQVGRLVANDFSAAMVTATLVELDPNTKEAPDPIEVGRLLEEMIRDPFVDDKVDIHMIGFSKAVHDIASGAAQVAAFFLIALAVTALFVRGFTRSWKLTLFPLLSSLLAVVWTMGGVTTLGYGLDPMSILVPFLIFAIAMSHGVQMVGAFSSALSQGSLPAEASKKAFGQLFVPGVVALLSDSVGFLTLLFIPIQVIQDLAVMSAIGVVLIFGTGFMLLPILLARMAQDEKLVERLSQPMPVREGLWARINLATKPRVAFLLVLLALTGGMLAYDSSTRVIIGDADKGLPELRPGSRYNIDSVTIADSFSIGVDLMTVIVESHPDGSIDHDVMDLIDEFQWRISHVEGVRSTISLPQVARILAAAWSEGSPVWRELPRNQDVLMQSLSSIETSTGLLNSDASVLPVMIFTEDHKAETIKRVTAAVEDFDREFGVDGTARFLLATGNVGVMAATNEVVSAAQMRMLLTIYGVVIVLGLLAFRSIRATLCVVLPLCLVSVLCYSLMVALGIGLKVSTLPVTALGVGIGVDYGIYLTHQLLIARRSGHSLGESYLQALRRSGNAVLVTGLTLAIGVATWIFSDLKLQADMGVLLSFMFAGNMIGALLLLPALHRFLPGGKSESDITSESDQ